MRHHLRLTYGQVTGRPLDQYKLHCLMHTIATHVRDTGADLACVKAGLGPATIQHITISTRHMTATYDAQVQTILRVIRSYAFMCMWFLMWHSIHDNYYV
jgi:hypothetical protein